MSLDIVQWNPINDEYGRVCASVYIKPTLELLSFLNRNSGNGNRTVMVRISGTNHAIYDGAPFLAIVDKSSDAQNCRQNFFNSTGLYIITLSTGWFGYPDKLGNITFLEGILDLNQDVQDQKIDADSINNNIANIADMIKDNLLPEKTDAPMLPEKTDAPMIPEKTESPPEIKENFESRKKNKNNIRLDMILLVLLLFVVSICICVDHS